VAPLSSPQPVATSTHHRAARRRPAWLFFFLLLPSPHLPRPCRVAGPSATVLAKVQPCTTSLPFVRVGLEPPRFSSIRTPPRYQRSALPHLHAHRSVAPTPDAALLACPSPAPALQRLHSSGLRAARSRTRHHVAPAPASASIPALPRVCAEPNHLCSRRPALCPVAAWSPRTAHALASRLPREQRPHPRLRAPARAHLRPCAAAPPAHAAPLALA
jgi:hypothetical protein